MNDDYVYLNMRPFRFHYEKCGIFLFVEDNVLVKKFYEEWFLSSKPYESKTRKMAKSLNV